MDDRFVRRFLGAGVGRNDLGVARFERTQGQAADGRFGVGARYDIGDDPDGFGVFTDSQGGVLFDQPAGFGIPHVPERSQGFIFNFIDLVFGIADIGFVHGHMTELMTNILFHQIPGHGLDHLIDFLLGPKINHLEGLAGAFVHFLDIVFHLVLRLYFMYQVAM